MQAIVTKYLPATNVRGSRIKATCQAGSVILSWDDSVNSDANHKAAAFALASKLQWDGRWIEGVTVDQHSVWVLDTGDARDTFTVEKFNRTLLESR